VTSDFRLWVVNAFCVGIELCCLVVLSTGGRSFVICLDSFDLLVLQKFYLLSFQYVNVLF